MKKIDPKGVVLVGKTVGLKMDVYDFGPDPKNYLFLCESGFGCHPNLRGQAVFGKLLNGPKAGESNRVERSDIEYVLVDEPDMDDLRGEAEHRQSCHPMG